MQTNLKKKLFVAVILVITLSIVLCGCTMSSTKQIVAEENSLLAKLDRTYKFDLGTGRVLVISLSEVSDSDLIFDVVEMEKGKEVGNNTIKMIADNIDELYAEGESFKAELAGFQEAFGGIFRDERHLVELYDDYMVILSLNPDDSANINSGIQLDVKND